MLDMYRSDTLQQHKRTNYYCSFSLMCFEIT